MKNVTLNKKSLQGKFTLGKFWEVNLCSKLLTVCKIPHFVLWIARSKGNVHLCTNVLFSDVSNNLCVLGYFVPGLLGSNVAVVIPPPMLVNELGVGWMRPKKVKTHQCLGSGSCWPLLFTWNEIASEDCVEATANFALLLIGQKGA